MRPRLLDLFCGAGGCSVGYAHGTNAYHRAKLGRNIREAEKREAMSIDWMSRAELAQAIPPAYTEHIGHYLLTEVARRCGERAAA